MPDVNYMANETRRLVRTGEPKADESLMGYILRLVSINRYDSITWVLKEIGIDITLIRSAFAFMLDDSTDLTRLADLANVNQELLRPLLYPSAKQRGSFSHLVFGHPFPKYMIKVKRPKICPECLRESNYYRKIWDLATVTACPVHKCLLLDECPNCSKRLSWFRKHVSVCQCEYDWRTHMPVKVRDSELGLVRQIYHLCGLDYGSKRVPLPDTNPLSNLELEDFAIAVVFIAGQYIGVNDVRGKQLATARKNEEIHRLLVKGASVFEEWPENFYEFLDWIRASRSNGRQTEDLHKDLGKFPYTLRMSLQSTTFDFMRLAFEEYLRSHWDGGLLVKGALRLTRDKFNQRKYISQKVALKRLKTSERLLHRFVKIGLLKVIICNRRVNKQYLLEREQVEELRLQINQLLRAVEVARRLGIGRVKVRDLVRDGCLRICNKFSGSGFKEWRFVESDVDGLLSAIEAKVTSQPAARARDFIGFKKALSRLSTLGVGLSKFVKALLDGEISPRFICKKNGLQRFTFDEQDLRDYSERYKRGLSEATITVDEAANRIGVNQASAYSFISRGLLFARTRHFGCRSRIDTTEEAVRQFNNTYVLAIKIAREVGTSTRFLYNCLAEEGVNPVAGKRVDGCYQYLYERVSLEKLDVADIILKAKTRLQPNGKCYTTVSCDQVCQILEIERTELEKLIEDGGLSPCIEVPATDERRASYVFRRAEVEKYRDENLDFTHLLSLEEALEMLGETYGQFYGRWVRRGRLTPVTFKHMPNKRFFRWEDVKRIIRFKRETVNSAQAAKILGVHSITIFKLTSAGKLKPVSGPHVDGYGWNLYSLKEVERMRDSRRKLTQSLVATA